MKLDLAVYHENQVNLQLFHKEHGAFSYRLNMDPFRVRTYDDMTFGFLARSQRWGMLAKLRKKHGESMRFNKL